LVEGVVPTAPFLACSSGAETCSDPFSLFEILFFPAFALFIYSGAIRFFGAGLFSWPSLVPFPVPPSPFPKQLTRGNTLAHHGDYCISAQVSRPAAHAQVGDPSWYSLFVRRPSLHARRSRSSVIHEHVLYWTPGLTAHFLNCFFT